MRHAQKDAQAVHGRRGFFRYFSEVRGGGVARRIVQRHGMALRTSPLGKYPASAGICIRNAGSDDHEQFDSNGQSADSAAASHQPPRQQSYSGRLPFGTPQTYARSRSLHLEISNGGGCFGEGTRR